MKRVLKLHNSKIIALNLSYKEKGDNSELAKILYDEQKGFCAYTETFLGRSDKKEIDHFNPKSNFSERNKYHNLFLVKGQWNNEKSNKWDNFQPVMHPTDPDFETRILYDQGDYYAANSVDIEAKHLIELLKLDDPDLAIERKKYINRKRGELAAFGSSIEDFFKTLISDDINSIQFLRAIECEFQIDIKSLI
ncbi:MAG TPA: HNH endonuclease domain-containing protein [Saprospiraceae bacterium]|nr:HNH endonuclease domain-containing protein [Saprospiraceae bacterium]